MISWVKAPSFEYGEVGYPFGGRIEPPRVWLYPYFIADPIPAITYEASDIFTLTGNKDFDRFGDDTMELNSSYDIRVITDEVIINIDQHMVLADGQKSFAIVYNYVLLSEEGFVE